MMSCFSTSSRTIVNTGLRWFEKTCDPVESWIEALHDTVWVGDRYSDGSFRNQAMRSPTLMALEVDDIQKPTLVDVDASTFPRRDDDFGWLAHPSASSCQSPARLPLSH